MGNWVEVALLRTGNRGWGRGENSVLTEGVKSTCWLCAAGRGVGRFGLNSRLWGRSMKMETGSGAEAHTGEAAVGSGLGTAPGDAGHEERGAPGGAASGSESQRPDDQRQRASGVEDGVRGHRVRCVGMTGQGGDCGHHCLESPHSSGGPQSLEHRAGKRTAQK